MIDVDAHDYLALPWQASAIPKSLRLPLYLRLILVVLSANLILVIVWLALARTVPLPDDPLASYLLVLPALSTRDLIAQGYTCQPPPDIAYLDYCSVQIETGPFSRMGVTLQRGGVFVISFIFREGTLRIGDVALLWGDPTYPTVRGYHESRVLNWQLRDRIARTVLDTESLNYWQPVRYIVFSTSTNSLVIATKPAG